MNADNLFATRINALRSSMKSETIDVFVSTHAPTLRYLCGYSGSNGLLTVSRDRSDFFTDFRYQEIIQTEVKADRKHVVKGSLISAAAKKKIFSRIKKVGIEKDHTTIAEFDIITTSIDAKKISPVAGIVEHLRMKKDESELRSLKRAFTISDKVFGRILDIIKPGMREIELSAEISYLHKSFGAEQDSFDVIVASGVRGSLPHGTASLKRISSGEFVTLDFGCTVDGYHSDMTRTICIGKPSKKMKQVYQIVFDAQRRSRDSVRHGVPARTVDRIARDYIAKKGFGKYFGHSLGHGVGLEIHELPRVAPKSKDTLEAGHVVTIEPGIYLPDEFGIRIEDTVIVAAKGVDVLTESPKELIVV